jgi:V/A-type H+-transporting ATPase subunit I
MLQATVIGHAAHADEVVTRLQRAGAIDIERIDIERGGVTRPPAEEQRRYDLDERIARAQFVRDFLGKYHEADVAFGAFISEKVHLGTAEFDELDTSEAFDELYRECEHISSRLGEIERERAHLHALQHDLAPWADMHLQIAQWTGTEHVALFAGTVPLSQAGAIRQALRDAVDELSIAEVGRDRDREAWVVMAHRSTLAETRAALALTEFTEVTFPDLSDYPAEEISRAHSRLEALDTEQQTLVARAAELETHYLHVFALVQALHTRREALEVRDNFAATERTFTARGWVPERGRADLEAVLEPVGDELDVSFDQPQPGQRVPVALQNPWFIRPFEVLTDLYGRPAYSDVDPTPLLAGFFFLFFGMCLGDVGYGVVLGIAAYLIKTRLDVGAGVKRFMDLLIAGGLASVLVGVATRSYFALSYEQLPGFLRYEPVLDPLEDIIVLLIVSVIIGVVHVLFGVFINVYRLVKAGDWATAIQEDLSSVLLLAGLGATALTGDVNVLWLTLGIGIVLKGRVIEAIVVDRSPLRALLGLPKGLLGLYGLTGFISDFLSYTRLAALGLASLLVGQVMNILATMVSGAPWGIGLVAAVLILVVGHAFNIVINLLGAFVHPARLQFVEFFSKFYEAGGRAYAPFSRRTTALVLHPAAGEQEGGTHS